MEHRTQRKHFRTVEGRRKRNLDVAFRRRRVHACCIPTLLIPIRQISGQSIFRWHAYLSIRLVVNPLEPILRLHYEVIRLACYSWMIVS